jgi:ribonucleoside-triphosphate reductase
MASKVKSKPPKYLHAFKSQLEQFVIIASNSTLGATGLADLLVTMSYYVSNILETKSDAHFKFASEEDCWTYVKEMLDSFIYSVNFDLRANQSPFTNVSVYDTNFLDKLCDDYIFPDGSSPNKEIIQRLQEMYLDIMNAELRRGVPLTFPVTTACFSIDEDKNIKDEAFLEMIAKKNLEFGFINIYCGDSSTLSSCCRLRSEQKSEYFNSFGSGSSKIGSLGVCSINFARLAFKHKGDENGYFDELKRLVGVCARINNAKRKIVEKRIKNGNEPLYTYEFMDLSKQYSTCGVNALYESLEQMGYDITTDSGVEFALKVINTINAENSKYEKQYGAPHNAEQVPGESLSVKFAEKDKIMKYQSQYDLYSNQFVPLIASADLLDRINIQGSLDKYFSGGSILHLNCDTRIEDYNVLMDLIRMTAKKGVIYHAINYVLQLCEDGHMSVGTNGVCATCGKPIVDEYTRVVGFLTNVKHWNKTRRKADYPNRKFYGAEELEV